jgi:hypothetical protein
VIELEQGSKPLALNTGDRAASHFPRVFVDADIDVSARSLFAACQPLAAGAALASAPALRVDLKGCERSVRRHYRVWTRLPYVTDRMVGSGVYALSQAGVPASTISPTSSVTMPMSAGSSVATNAHPFLLMQRVSRSSLRSTRRVRSTRWSISKPGARPPRDEMNQMFGEAPDDTHASQRRALLALAFNPLNWAALATYLWVKTESRRRFRSRKATGAHKQWLRDESSRSTAHG